MLRHGSIAFGLFEKKILTLHVEHSKPQNCLNCSRNEQYMSFGNKRDNV
jgi:hypothetical protein